MNTLTADGFTAERQPNGDVWITSRKRKPGYNGGKAPPEESAPIIIPKDKCGELASLLRLGMVKGSSTLTYPGTVPRTDYTRGPEEPE